MITVGLLVNIAKLFGYTVGYRQLIKLRYTLNFSDIEFGYWIFDVVFDRIFECSFCRLLKLPA